MKYTHQDLARDRLSKTHGGHYGNHVAWNRYNLDLDALWGGPGVEGVIYDMAEWCIDNCANDWALHWNEERAIFNDESDAVAFKLRWM